MSKLNPEDQTRDNWARVQTIFTVLTPLVLGVGGYFLNINQQSLSQEISALQQTIAQVEVMQPYIDMIVGEDTSKARTAAYALYMLRKDDPQIVIDLVLASDNQALHSVLVDLIKRDPELRSLIFVAMRSKEGEFPVSLGPQEKAARAILAEVTAAHRGWCYLGTFQNYRLHRGGKIELGVAEMDQVNLESLTIDIDIPKGKGPESSYIIAPHDRFDIIRSTYVREQPPTKSYELGAVAGVLEQGAKISLKDLKFFRTKWGIAIWANFEREDLPKPIEGELKRDYR
jgi:hypothetical protein